MKAKSTKAEQTAKKRPEIYKLLILGKALERLLGWI